MLASIAIFATGLTSVFLMMTVHTLQQQTADLQSKLAGQKTVQASSDLPPGSVTFTQLAPSLQTLLGRQSSANTTPSLTSATAQNAAVAVPPAGSKLSDPNIWTGTQTFAKGLTLNGTTFTSLLGSGLEATNGILGARISTANIQDNAVTFSKLDGSGCTANQVLQYTGTLWSCGTLGSGITSINELTAPAQFLTLNSSGTDVSLTSSIDTTTLSIPTVSASNRGVLSATDYTSFSGKQAALTFSTGLTNTGNTITNNLATGVSGGQTVTGGTAANGTLTLTSTSNATKGKIIFGTSAYDEANNRLGIGTTTPSFALDLSTTSASGLLFNVSSTSTNLSNSGLAAFNWAPSSSKTSTGDLVSINAGANATIGSLLNVSNNGTSVFKVGQTNVTFGAPVTFTSGTSEPVTVVFDNYTVTNNDNIILAEAPNAAVTVTLPNPTTVTTGRTYTIKRLDTTTFTLTIASAGGAQIEQQSTIGLTHQGNSVQVVSDGTAWQIVNQWTSSYTYGTQYPYNASNTGSLGN